MNEERDVDRRVRRKNRRKIGRPVHGCTQPSFTFSFDVVQKDYVRSCTLGDDLVKKMLPAAAVDIFIMLL